MSSVMNDVFICLTWANKHGTTIYRTIQMPATFNELMWYAYRDMGINVPVEAVFNHYGTRKEITLTDSNYKTMTSYSRVCFRPDGRPSLQDVIDQATKEEDAALEAARMKSAKQTNSDCPVLERKACQ